MRSRSASQIWQAALGELQLQVSRANFETWLAESEGIAFEDGSFVVGVPTGFAAEWLQKRLRPIIHKTLDGLLGQEVEVRFVVHHRPLESLVYSGNSQEPGDIGNGLGKTEDVPDNGASRERGGSRHSIRFNPKYTFDTFIAGSSNRLAYAAALSVAEKPGQVYSHNPLFIYGPTGLGKTHLLHAIGRAAEQAEQTVIYISAEQFTNEFISALQGGHTEDFRLRYRSATVLLVDDIQFLAGKEQTQERFFHTFNDLHNANRQIVLSSDRPPAALRPLEERLRSRFEGGLLADIQPPDLETRIAILKAEAVEQHVNLPQDILEMIARRVPNNIRDLKGALNRFVAYGRLTGAAFTLSLATQVMADSSTQRGTSALSARPIIEAVATAFRLDPEDLLGKRRSKDIALARQVAMYLLREEAQLSLAQTGRELGGRDHTTVLHGCSKIAETLDRDHRLQRQVDQIRERLYRQETA